MNATFEVDSLEALFEQQRTADYACVAETVAERKQHLRQLQALLLENKGALIAAIQEDYGSRSYHETLYAEIITVVDGIQQAIKALKGWAKPQRRVVNKLLYFGAANYLVPQPLGCVGIIAPWNFPLALSFGPLTCAFAAGNRAMVKMSRNSSALCKLLMRLSPDYFPAEKLTFVAGSGGAGSAFAALPFDLLLFTGSGETGKSVMSAAASNLTPVVLELGGKCPAYIDADFPVETAVQRLLYIKHFNAGQICVNVDYVFVHQRQVDRFVAAAEAWAKNHLSSIHSPDYTSIIDASSFKRLQDTIADAEAKGATVVNLHGSQAPCEESRKMPMQLVLNTSEDMVIRERETFGPLLMVLTYEDDADVIDYLKGRDSPLAFYPFTHNRKKLNYFIDNTRSGGVTVNDASFHIVQHDLPFGGVGASGMGHYHGREGFETFSKLRPIHRQARWPLAKLLQPPYGAFATRVYETTYRWFARGINRKKA